VEEGLSKEDVTVALNFLHVWHQKQCMCVFRSVQCSTHLVSNRHLCLLNLPNFCGCMAQPIHFKFSGNSHMNIVSYYLKIKAPASKLWILFILRCRFFFCVADPGSGAFWTPGSGVGFFRIPDPDPGSDHNF